MGILVYTEIIIIRGSENFFILYFYIQFIYFIFIYFIFTGMPQTTSVTESAAAAAVLLAKASASM